MTDLSKLKCVACQGGEPTLTDEQINDLLPQVREWRVKEENGEKRPFERLIHTPNYHRR